ncbi:MAG: nuclear transport factor 2 family protein [Bacteroidota bacterium]
MKKTLVLFMILLAGLSSHGQQAADGKPIQAAIITLFDAVAKLDDAGIKAQCTSDFTLIERGQVLNADTLIKWLAPLKGRDIKRVNTINFVKTGQQGNTAWVVYYNTAEMIMGDKHRTAKWLESATLVKEGTVWKIKLLHSTDLK